ncbi:uncharacterized protein PAC_01365 [Phialocephala subalpina]|uniref:Uncharacterized protein n=1 Tax=Phialocephala subalpina TaxID=576137 RepID=A0A1L7WFH6_9HELO|nr:uncharacterized protein PAC_01365 [Phialocephala subalpina]
MKTLAVVHPAVNDHRDGLDLIYIHGISFPGGDRESEKWKLTIPEIAPPNSSLWEFDLRTELGDKFNAESFMRKSTDLLNDVFTMHQSLKALWNASRRITQFNEVIESISGIVFLATPHFIERDERTSHALSHILRQSSTKATRASDFEALPIFTTACQEFDELRMQIPILSCYESRSTALQQYSWFLWRWYHYEILVDIKLAETSAPDERLEVINTDLHSIFDDVNTPLQHEIFKYLKNIAERAPERLRASSMFLREVESLNISPNHSLNSIGFPEWSTEVQYSDAIITLSRESSMKQSESTNPQTPSTPQSSLKPRNSSSSFQLISNRLNKALIPQCAVKLPCYFTGPFTGPDPHFQGRLDILGKIDQTFQCEPGTPVEAPETVVTFTLCGLGGVGKTAVAKSYMFSRKECFQAVFWLQADQGSKLDDSFKKIATQLGLEVSDDAVVNKERVHTWLSRPNVSREIHESQKVGPERKKASWLIVFDNAEDPALLKDYFPPNGQGYVLITRRNPLPNPTYPRLLQNPVTLESLHSSEAVTLFRELVDSDYDLPTSPVNVIVQKLHSFPLSIVHMAGIINYRKLPLDQFLKDYDKIDQRVELHSTYDGMKTIPEHGYSKTLSTMWSLESLSISCSRLLCAMALLDPDCIQEDIFLKKPQEFHFVGFPTTPDEYTSALDQLIQMAIVSRLSGPHRQLAIHHIVRELVQEDMTQIGPGKPRLSSAFVAVTIMLYSMWPFALLQKDGAYQKYGQTNRWEPCKALLPHIESLKQIFDSYRQLKDGRPLATMNLGWLVIEAAQYQHEIGNFNKSKEFIEAAFEIQGLCTGNETQLRELLSAIHNVWGTLAAATNDDTAVYHQEKCLDIEKQLFRDSQRPTSRLAIAYSDLGRAKIANGRFEGVKNLFEKSKEIRQKLPNFDELQLYNPSRGIAMVHYYYGLQQGNNQQEFIKARDCLLHALAVREAKWGENDTEGGRTGSLLYELGNVYNAIGMFLESMKYYLRAYKQWSSTLGDSHRNTATACYKVACHYFDQGDIVEALNYLDKAKTVFGEGSLQRPELARTLFKMSQCYEEQHMTADAQSTLNDAWRFREQFLGGDDPLQPNQLKESHFDECVEWWSR